MTGIIERISMTIRRLAKQIGVNFNLFNFYDYIQETNFFARLFIGKSKVEVKFVKIFQKFIKIFLCICPNEKNILDESFLKPRFYLLRF